MGLAGTRCITCHVSRTSCRYECRDCRGAQTGHRMRNKEGWNYFRLTEAPLSVPRVPCLSVMLMLSSVWCWLDMKLSNHLSNRFIHFIFACLKFRAQDVINYNSKLSHPSFPESWPILEIKVHQLGQPGRRWLWLTNNRHLEVVWIRFNQ